MTTTDQALAQAIALMERGNEIALQQTLCILQVVDVLREQSDDIRCVDRDVDKLFALVKRHRPYGSRANPLKTRSRPWLMRLRRI